MAACRACIYPQPECTVHTVCPRLPWPGARPAAPATTSMAAELFLVESKRLFKAPASHGSTLYGATSHDTPSSFPAWTYSMTTQATAARVQEVEPKLPARSIHATFLICDISGQKSCLTSNPCCPAKLVAPYDEIHCPAVKNLVDRGETPLREAVKLSRDG